MSGLLTHLSIPLTSLLVGWMALWPTRRQLGALGYHLSAYPVGLLSCVAVTATSTLRGHPLDWTSVALGLAVYVLLGWVTARAAGTGMSDQVRPAGVPAWTFAVAALAATGASAVLAASQLTVVSGDSWNSYWPRGLQLARDGVFTAPILAERGVLIPSLNAIHTLFGGDWLYVAYPMLAANMLLLLVYALVRRPGSGRTSKVGAWVASGTLAFLLTTPLFVSHAFYVHSHLLSATYLLLSLMAVEQARSGGDVTPAKRSWLMIAGFSTAGLALTRPDGLAYALIPVLSALALLTAASNTSRGRSTVVFFVPMIAPVLLTYLAAFLTLGLWESSKLGGHTSAILVALLAACCLVPASVARLRSSRARLMREDWILALTTAGASLVILVVAALRWDMFRLAVLNAGSNLFMTGAWWHVWYAFAALLLLTVLSGDALRPGSATRRVFLSIALFFVVAVVVHGTSHVGRVGPTDSFNRVAFHIVPVILWYAGMVLHRILGSREVRNADASP